LHSWQTGSGVLNIKSATWKLFFLPIARISLRACRVRAVESATVKHPRLRRYSIKERKSLNASLEAAIFVSSSLTRRRQRSEDTTAVSAKWFKAKVVLPQPGGPLKTRRVVFGTDMDGISNNLPQQRTCLVLSLAGSLFVYPQSYFLSPFKGGSRYTTFLNIVP
jgi:hypothetical protein